MDSQNNYSSLKHAFAQKFNGVSKQGISSDHRKPGFNAG
jgi:hypothetical protein